MLQSVYSLGERMGKRDAQVHQNLLVQVKGIPTIKNDWPSALMIIETASAQDKGHKTEDERLAALVWKAPPTAQRAYAHWFVTGYVHGRRHYLSGPQTPPTDAGNLRVLWPAVALYAQDHDGLLPPLRDAHAFQAALLPYVSNYAGYFRDVTTREPYRINRRLAGKTLASVADPSHTVLLYQASPFLRGGPYVLYLNGDVRRVNVVQWRQIWLTLGSH
ncbi:MAG: hypothetical protein JO250_16760 [Armatimonadetes bacterium]|nr:hypothetical protein [Armatimonadota bacterium]